MKYYLCLYDLEGKLLFPPRAWSCIGCGWKHMPKLTPACLRKGSTQGEIVRKNVHFIKIEKKVK